VLGCAWKMIEAVDARGPRFRKAFFSASLASNFAAILSANLARFQILPAVMGVADQSASTF